MARESIFSGMNNLGVYSILRQEYNEQFGFTENEVLKLLEDYNIKEMFPEVKKWYDGYSFGKRVIYNPWSILNFVSSKDRVCRPYWVNTGSLDIIKGLVEHSSQTFKEGLYELLNNAPIIKTLDENIVFDELEKDENALYSFLVFSGYLNASDMEIMGGEEYYALRIPNMEVMKAFRNVISKWIKDFYENKDLTAMLNALLENNLDTFGEYLNDFVLKSLSYFDTGKNNPEKVYQAFILGMLVTIAPDYETYSNRESGLGRFDISVIPKDKQRQAFIMELKTLKPGQTKDAALKSALAQIEDKKYEADIIKRGILDIVKLGVVFDGKRVWVARG